MLPDFVTVPAPTVTAADLIATEMRCWRCKRYRSCLRFLPRARPVDSCRSCASDARAARYRQQRGIVGLNGGTGRPRRYA